MSGNNTCAYCSGAGKIFKSSTEFYHCDKCNGTGEKQYKVVKTKAGFTLVPNTVLYALYKSYFNGTYAACEEVRKTLNETRKR